MARFDSGVTFDSGARFDEPDPAATTGHQMGQNLISAVMTDAQRDAMLADLDAFDTKFETYKVSLTPQQIRHLTKLKPEDIGLLELALTFAEQNPAEVPASFGTAELSKDIALAKQLTKVNAKAKQKSDMTAAALIAGMSDGYSRALRLHRTEKAKGRTPANEAFLDAFGERFGKNPPEPPAPPNP